MKITKKELKILRTIILGAIGWIFFGAPLQEIANKLIPDLTIRAVVGIIVILSIFYIWDLK